MDECVYAYVCILPNFQTAQFQSNILIHLISYMVHVVTLDLEKQNNQASKFLQKCAQKCPFLMPYLMIEVVERGLVFRKVAEVAFRKIPNS